MQPSLRSQQALRIYLTVSLVIACCLCTIVAQGQTYFYFEHRLPAGDSYFLFVTLQPDGNATARLRHADSVQVYDQLLDISLVDSLIEVGTDDPPYRYLVANGAPGLLAGDSIGGWQLPRLRFKRVQEGEEWFYVPDGADYRTAEGKWTSATIVESREKTIPDLTADRDFVELFFKPLDDFHQFLFAPKPGLRDPKPRTERLFLLAIGNTNDLKVGVSAVLDLQRITTTFRQLAAALNMRIVVRQVDSSRFNKVNIETAFAEMKPGPSDIFLVFYSGHGFRYTNDKGAFARMSLRRNTEQDLGKNNLPLEDLYNRMLKKGAKVTMLIGDCCNSDIGETAPVGRDILRVRSAPSAPPMLNTAVCNALLFPQQRVSMLVGSANVGELAVGNPKLGGFFTFHFIGELQRALYGNGADASWLQLLLKAQKAAARQALSAPCGAGRCVQTPTFRMLP